MVKNNRWLTFIIACFCLLCLAAIGTGSTAIAKTPTTDMQLPYTSMKAIRAS